MQLLPCHIACTFRCQVGDGVRDVRGQDHPAQRAGLGQGGGVALAGVGYAGLQLFPLAMLPDTIQADALRTGRTRSGARAASSHTGSLAGADNAVDALCHQSGVIRTDTIEEMFDVAMVLANQPLPRGNRIGIITNAGGPAIMASDA